MHVQVLRTRGLPMGAIDNWYSWSKGHTDPCAESTVRKDTDGENDGIVNDTRS
jgi:hypothetical protein